jgi:ABC-type polysaccharide/polyol phosphate export permease
MKEAFINYALCYPITYAISFAYIQTNIIFGSGNDYLGTMLFAGNIIIIMLLISYKTTIELLFDLEHNRFINYQIITLNPRLVILERIFFASLYTFILSSPFFIVAKLCLGSSLQTDQTSWISLYAVLYAGSLCCASYHQFAALLLRSSSSISTLWARVNHALITFGGFWIPLYLFKQYSLLLGALIYLNPMAYITEGLRRSLLGTPNFMPVPIAVFALYGFSILFIILSWYVFKKRVDHI